MATIGLGQVRSETEFELALVTAGNDITHLNRFIQPGCSSYTAVEVIRYLLNNGE